MSNGIPFSGFNDGVRLYAKNVRIVEEMRAQFLLQVLELSDALFQTVQQQLRGTLHENRIPKRDVNRPIRRWWLADGEPLGKSDFERHGYVCFYTDAPEIVLPGTLTMSAFVRKPLKPYRHQFAMVQDQLQLPPLCRVCAGKDGSLFDVEISYGNQDPLAIAAQPIAQLVSKLHEAEHILLKR